MNVNISQETIVISYIATSTVPHQWKHAYIQPVPKVATPQQCSDYRPISITPVTACP